MEMITANICNYLNCNLEELKNMRFFAEMEGSILTPFVGIGISDGHLTWRDCVVDESRYELERGYKITLKCVNTGDCRHYYQSDFLPLLEEGIILVKTSRYDRVKHVVWEEHDKTSGFTLRHEADIVVKERSC